MKSPDSTFYSWSRAQQQHLKKPRLILQIWIWSWIVCAWFENYTDHVQSGMKSKLWSAVLCNVVSWATEVAQLKLNGCLNQNQLENFLSITGFDFPQTGVTRKHQTTARISYFHFISFCHFLALSPHRFIVHSLSFCHPFLKTPPGAIMTAVDDDTKAIKTHERLWLLCETIRV